ncbi:MAG: S8 family serine peptidase [bacterium]|nr:S8 family serine peptidase [bacterium]
MKNMPAAITLLLLFALSHYLHAEVLPRPIDAPFIPSLRQAALRTVIIDETQPARYLHLAGRIVDPVAKRDHRGLAVDLSAAQKSPTDDLYIVQFTMPLTPVQVTWLGQRNLTLLRSIPQNAFVVRLHSSDAAALRALPGVRWLGAYAPQFRISELLETARCGRAGTLPTIRLAVLPAPGADTKLLASQLEHLGSREPDDDGAMIVTVPTKLIDTVASLPGVLLVDYAPLHELHNSVAAGIVDARDMWTIRNFTGSNEIIAVADSGLDIGTNSTAIHDDFENNLGATRIAQIYDNLGDGASDPYSGHGTHVAGSALGNGVLSGAWPQTNGFPSTSHAGIAPKARLVFQAQGSNNPSVAGTIFLPTGILGLFNQAYAAGARIHNNSWGSDLYGEYDNACRDLDLFTFKNPDFFVCFSAGNAGVDTNPANGVVDLGSIGSPAAAKNCTAVGATENVRNSTESGTWGAMFPGRFPNAPINNDHVANAPTGMAAFSSRGPCQDGRIKPDIVAPGTFIASTLSHAIPPGSIDSTLWGRGSLLAGQTNYVFSGGTSMAAPLVAGAAAVIREYLHGAHNFTNPPAALIKAILLNGATDIAPGQYGTGATQETGPAPNSIQGWGRLTLENAFYGPPTYRMYFWTNTFTAPNTFLTNVVIYDTNIPFKATLAWTDMAGSLFALNASLTAIRGGGLMNDLDLRVVDPTGKTNFPLAQNTRLDLFYYTNNTFAAMSSSPAGLLEAEKCTAPQRPLTITHIFKVIYDSSGAGGNHGTFIWAEGAGGLPGTALFAVTNTLPSGSAGFNFLIITLPSPLTITSSNFFIGTQLIATNVRQARDANSGSPRTYVNSGSGWSYQNAGDMWIHAYGTVSTGDHINTVESVVIRNPPLGTYQILVSGANVPYTPVRWGMAYSGGFVPEPAGGLTLVATALLLLKKRRTHVNRI